ncbi:MAG: hypothetical protein SNJ70_08660 [Armatimonadota bacterium]
MNNLNKINNPYNELKVSSACSIFGMMDVSGERFSGDKVYRAMENMRDRGNGLGAGFAIYGIYPDHADAYCLHIMFTSQEGRRSTEQYLYKNFKVEQSEEIATRIVPGIFNPPHVFR